MNITITQDNSRIETLGSNGASIIQKLYELAIDSNNTLTLRGNISSASAYEEAVTYLNNTYGPDFTVSATNKYLKFEDAVIETLCVKYFGDGVGVTKQQLNEASIIKYVDGVRFIDALHDTKFKKFNEFQYFTKVTDVTNDYFSNNTTLEELTLPPTCTKIGVYSFFNTASDNADGFFTLRGTENITEVGFYSLYHAKGYTLNFNIVSGMYEANGYSVSEFRNCANQYIIFPKNTIANNTTSSNVGFKKMRVPNTLVFREDFVCNALGLEGENGYSSVTNVVFLSTSVPFNSVELHNGGPSTAYVPSSAVSNYSGTGFATISTLDAFANISDDNKAILVEAGCTVTGSTGNWTIKAPGEA